MNAIRDRDQELFRNSLERPFELYGRSDLFCRLVDHTWASRRYWLLFIAYAIWCFGSSFLIALLRHATVDFFRERDWVIINGAIAPCFAILTVNFCDRLPRLYAQLQLAGDLRLHTAAWYRILANLKMKLQGEASWRIPAVAGVLGVFLSIGGVWTEQTWKGLPAVKAGTLPIWAFIWMRLIVALNFYIIISLTLRVSAVSNAISELLKEPIRLRHSDPDNSCGLGPVAAIWLRLWFLVILGGLSLLIYILPGLGHGWAESRVPSAILIGIYLWFLFWPVLRTFVSARGCLLRFRRFAYDLSTTDPVRCWRELHWNYRTPPPFSIDQHDHWDELQKTIGEIPSMPGWWPKALLGGLIAWLGLVTVLIELFNLIER